jgi:serine/threonine-protein kinase
MSPEQCQSDNLDPRADIYSIGVIIFEMITGKLPYTGDSPLAIALKHVSEPVPSPRKYMPDLPEEVEAVILKAMSKKRQERQQSALELGEELAAAVGYTGAGGLRQTGELGSIGRPKTLESLRKTGDRQSGAKTGENEGPADLSTNSYDVSDSPDMQTGIASGRNTSALDSGRNKSGESATVNERSKGTSRIGATNTPKKGGKKTPPAHEGGTLAMTKGEDQGGGTLAMGSAAGQQGGQQEVESKGSSKLPIYIVAAVVVIAVLVVGGLKLMSGDKPADKGGTVVKNGGETTAPAAPKNIIEIPGGTFRMGRDEGKDQFGKDIPPLEVPGHLVTVKPFSIGKFEVTNREYAEFLQGSGRQAPPEWGGTNEGAADQPVFNVSWEDATEYCKWLAKKENKPYRLPTEEEWEFAARGTESRLFPWGPLYEPGIANTVELAGGKGLLLPITSSTLAKDVSPFGVIGMSGNVSEWTSSDAKLYPGNSQELAVPPNTKVARGSNYESSKSTSTATFRLLFPSTQKDPHVGFRIAMDK